MRQRIRTLSIYFGPELPAGSPESNWIQTNPGAGWFVLFRFYGPTEALVKKEWTLGDLEKVESP